MSIPAGEVNSTSAPVGPPPSFEDDESKAAAAPVKSGMSPEELAYIKALTTCGPDELPEGTTSIDFETMYPVKRVGNKYVTEVERKPKKGKTAVPEVYLRDLSNFVLDILRVERDIDRPDKATDWQRYVQLTPDIEGKPFEGRPE